MNLIRERTAAVAIAALAVAAGLSACKGKGEYASADTTTARSDSAAGSAMSAPAMATRTDTSPTAAATPSTALPAAANSDAGILGFAWVADNEEVALGQLAETKATNPAVKAFARRMVTDHKAMLASDKALATKLSIAGDTTAADARDLMRHGNDELKDLTDKAAGADWDKDFMGKMVDDHQKVLDKLQDASKNTATARLRTALEATTGKVQQHLTKAKDIVAKNLKD